jgi:hypothetical protein
MNQFSHTCQFTFNNLYLKNLTFNFKSLKSNLNKFAHPTSKLVSQPISIAINFDIQQIDFLLTDMNYSIFLEPFQAKSCCRAS